MSESTTPASGPTAAEAPQEPWPTTPAVVETSADVHPERRPSPSKVWGILVALLLVAGLVAVGANQLYRAGARTVEEELAKRPVPDLARQHALEEAVLHDTARYVDNGEWYRIPVERARDIILAHPGRLGAFPAPQGWIHPDDEKNKKTGPATP